MPRDLKRRKVGTRAQRRIVLIFCEGSETEPTYFRGFNTRYSNVLVEPVYGKVTAPRSIVGHAIAHMSEYNIDIEEGDGVWCVFDADSNTDKELAETMDLAERHGISVAFSNPSFELWYLLHYEYRSRRLSNEEAESELRKHMPDYSKSGNFNDVLKESLDMAIKNAKKLDKMHRSKDTEIVSQGSNPTSQVYLLVKFIEDLKRKNRRSS
jgi:hypothetical protein